MVVRQLRVQMLGSLRVTFARDDQSFQSLTLPQGPISELMGYLALYSATPIPRSRLAGLLNPDTAESFARRTLTDTLYRLRRELDAASDCIQADAENIWLNHAQCWVDAHEFERCAGSAHSDDWRHALELYSGDLLQDQDAEWLLAPRATLREQFLVLHERLCTMLLNAGKWSDALAYTHRWTLADPLCEEAYRLAMQLYARLGRPAAALELYQRLGSILANEMQIEPMPQTRALAEKIRAESQAALEHSIAPHIFIGRRSERARLLHAAEQTFSGRGGLVLVEGEPGIGKTYLLEEFADGAAWRGLNAVWGRAREREVITPFAPLDQALAAALSRPRAEQIRAHLAPAIVQTVGFLSPHLANDQPIPLNAPPDVPHALSQLAQALASFAPYVFILDDAQWADDGLWEVLRKLAPRLAASPLLIVLSYRSRALRANEIAWTCLRDLDRELVLTKIVLHELGLDERVELARALEPSLDDQTARAICESAGGNPLFLTETLQTTEHTSTTFHALIEHRWAMLAPDARAALQAAAILGREFTHAVWQASTDTRLITQIPLFSAMRFIEETANGYCFPHDLIREYVFQTIAPADCPGLHRRAGEALRDANAEPTTLAWHFEQAQAWKDAARYYRTAGEYAEQTFAFDAALSHYQRALELVARLENAHTERLALLRHRQRVEGIRLRASDWRKTAADLEQAAIHAHDATALLEALEARVTLHALDSDWVGMQQVAERAIDLATSIDNHEVEARIQKTLGWHLADSLGQQTAARLHLQRAIELAKALGNQTLLVGAFIDLAFSQRMSGQCATARETAQRALALISDHAELRLSRASALQTLGQIEIDLARWESAYEAMRVVVELKMELKDAWSAGQALYNQAILATSMGQHAQARQIIQILVSGLSSTDNQATLNNWMWVQALSAETYILAGDLAGAERTLDEMRAWIETTEGGRALLLALSVLGQLRLAQQRPRDALAPLARAVRLWQDAPTVDIAHVLFHALAANRCGDKEAAFASLALAEHALADTEVARYNVLLNYCRYELSGRIDDLRTARAEMQRQAAFFSDEKLRADFLSKVALHREIESRWRALNPAPPQFTIRLARSDAPLGKTLGDADYVAVQWTVDAGPADAEVLQREGKVALRHHRLRRLIDEAHTQGAAPTDADLARALEVATRTIERDMAILLAAGKRAHTRRRKPTTTV